MSLKALVEKYEPEYKTSSNASHKQQLNQRNEYQDSLKACFAVVFQNDVGKPAIQQNSQSNITDYLCKTIGHKLYCIPHSIDIRRQTRTPNKADKTESGVRM